MFTGLWNYLSGYVIIELEGKALERFLNRLTHSGVEIWHIRRTGINTVTAHISIAGFYALRPMLRGQGIRVHILQKRGLIIRLSSLRFRKVLLYGWTVAAVLLIAASRRIWFIEITGLDTVPQQNILSVLAQNGIREGAWRSAVHTAPLGNSIMASDPRIAWAGAHLDGVTLRVDILEAGDAAKLPDHDPVPASIYASSDGVVSSVTVLEGRALVREGDAVKAGQELITGILRNDEANLIVTRAKGTVLAQVVYRFTASAGPKILAPQAGEEVERCTRISAFGKTFFSRPATDYAQETALFEGSLTNCFLPLTVQTLAVYPTVMKEITASESELRQAAMLAAEDAMERALPEHARILSKESTTEYREDGSVEAAITVITEENIGITKEFEATNGKQPQ
ncbi:MAG: sporulation protein YqfD [Clostridia bacterium]|nr:sporulation protein YqfD [Clostridia bacterium]